MLTLALDTTGDFGSIALADEDCTMGEVLLHAPQGFSHVLFAQIEALLEREGRVLADVDFYAAASGPGSFTGVRVGLSAVKAFAEVHGKPVAAVSNLVALASFGSSPLRAAVIDARRGEVYAGLFDAHGKTLIPEQVIAFPRFVEQLVEHSANAEIEWISCDFAPFLPALAGTPFGNHPVITTAPRALAAAVARLALHSWKESREESYLPEAVDANYIRRSDAELFWKEI